MFQKIWKGAFGKPVYRMTSLYYDVSQNMAYSSAKLFSPCTPPGFCKSLVAFSWQRLYTPELKAGPTRPTLIFMPIRTCSVTLDFFTETCAKVHCGPQGISRVTDEAFGEQKSGCVNALALCLTLEWVFSHAFNVLYLFKVISDFKMHK